MPRRKKQDPSRSARTNRILVPIDFTSASVAALGQARKAARAGSEITMIHVIAPSDGLLRDGAVAVAQARKRLGDLARSPDDSVRRSIKLVVRIGTPYREIVAMAEKENFELLVVGLRASMHCHSQGLGNTADRLCRYAPCPVLLVRGNATENSAIHP